MPGHNPDDYRSGSKFDNYVEAIGAVLAKHASPVILAGHSSVGFLLQMAAPKSPDKIQQLIFHNAFILPDGKCQFDLAVDLGVELGGLEALHADEHEEL